MYNAEGRVVDGRVRSFVCREPISAEAMALKAAADLAASYGRRTIVVSDCQTLIEALKDQLDQWPWKVAAILASITQTLRNHEEISIFHVGR
ncbi:hypothetical protein LINPERPRIM_LOCUS30393, partial [Linum perenne]